VTVVPPPGPQQAEPNELLVAWPSAAEADAGIAEIQALFGVAPVERVPLPALVRVLAVYRLSSAGQAETVRAQLAIQRPQWLVDFNTLYFTLADPRQYAASQVDLPAGGSAATPARIGMLDTRVESVPALAGKPVVRKRFGAADAAPAHGTAVAVLLAGRDAARGFEGAAAGAELYAGEVMRARAGRDDTNARIVLEGLDWLLAEHARVVNLSLGGASNRLLADAIETLVARAVVVVAAAGNAGRGAPPAYPAAYPGVIAVTANDAAGRVYERANSGPYIALSAPGVDVWVPDGGDGRYVSGTSFAAAWVSGAAARLVGQAPRLKPPQVRAQFCAAARDLGAPGRDAVFGCGLLQMKRALEFAGAR
jgi:subtilisin family serine protease